MKIEIDIDLDAIARVLDYDDRIKLIKMIDLYTSNERFTKEMAEYFNGELKKYR